MDRKELLGAVFDEIEHHFKVFKVERNAYLALAGIASLCLIAAAVVLVWQRGASPALAAAILGGAGLVAFAAGRSSAYFHGTLSTVEQVVKRYSKISDPELVSTVDALKRKSETSLLLMLIGAGAVVGSVVFAFARVHAIEQAVDQAQEAGARAETEAAALKTSFAGAQQAYAALKASVTALHPVHVTLNHEVVQIRAAARPATPKSWGGAAAYRFSLGLHSSPATLASIKRVRYRVLYPDAPEQTHTAEDPASGFTASFNGPGCLSAIEVALEMQSGSADRLTFDQCASLGPQWTPLPVARPPEAAQR